MWERGNAAINSRAVSRELADELLAPGFCIENISTAVTDKSYEGVKGVREWIVDTSEGLDEDARYESEEILAVEDDYLVARVRVAGRGARSGAPVLRRLVSVVWFRDGKMARSVGYARRLEALEAVGLQG